MNIKAIQMSSSDGINNSNHTSQEFWNRSSETGLIKVCMQTVKLLQNVFDFEIFKCRLSAVVFILFRQNKIRKKEKQ